MALSPPLSATSSPFLTAGLPARPRARPSLPPRSIRPKKISAAATPPERRTRLGRTFLNVPRSLDRYFEGNLYRQVGWCFVAAGAGYYSANTVTLTFGTLAINDVVAAVVTLAFVEIVSYFYWTAPKITLKLNLINSFKNGVIAALIADALKLGA
eukprot:evm.model.scf_488EXC.4 EVM.evm.TU.scf_488EXC.4   scf_488EXC:22155-22922(+)